KRNGTLASISLKRSVRLPQARYYWLRDAARHPRKRPDAPDAGRPPRPPPPLALRGEVRRLAHARLQARRPGALRQPSEPRPHAASRRSWPRFAALSTPGSLAGWHGPRPAL